MTYLPEAETPTRPPDVATSVDVATVLALLAEFADTRLSGVQEVAMSAHTLELLRASTQIESAPAAARLWAVPVVVDDAIALGVIEVRPEPAPTLDDVAAGRAGMREYLDRCLAAHIVRLLDDESPDPWRHKE